jgi:hypothetical protein
MPRKTIGRSCPESLTIARADRHGSSCHVVFAALPTRECYAQSVGTPTNDGQALCQSCGLCCDGTLFAQVKLTSKDDVPLLRAAGIDVDSTASRPSFRLPCACHRDGLCHVYDRRPDKCASYRCRLLKRYESGEVSHAAALEIIAQAVRHRDDVRMQLRYSPGGGHTLQDAFRDACRDEDRRPAPRLLLTYGALQYRLDRDFREKNTTSDPVSRDEGRRPIV